MNRLSTGGVWRTVFAVLLLANVVFFLADRWLDPAPAPDQSLPRGMTRIALHSEVPPPPPKRCISIGPFRAAAELAAASNLLREVGYVPRNRTETADVADGYLVMLTGIRNSNQLDSAMTRLRRAGITDAAIVPDGAPGIRVSLGQFAALDGAEKRAAAARQVGLRADVLERMAPGPVSWLDIDLRQSGEELDPAAFDADGSLQVKPCPTRP